MNEPVQPATEVMPTGNVALLILATACLPATAAGVVWLIRRFRSGRGLPLPDGDAYPALRLPAGWGLALFFLILYPLWLILGGIAQGVATKFDLSAVGRLWVLTGAQLLVVVVGVAVLQAFGDRVGASMGMRAGRVASAVRRALVATAFVLPPALAFSSAIQQLLRYLDVPEMQHPILVQAAEASPETVAWLFVMVAFVVPIAEEFMFRGVLLTPLMKLAGAVPAFVVSAGFFSIAHAWTQPHALPSLFLLGMVLAYLAYRGRSLTAPILCHGLFNAIMLTAHIWK